MGQKSVAITDHGVMYGVIDTTGQRERGIKPIIGCEIYVTKAQLSLIKFPTA